MHCTLQFAKLFYTVSLTEATLRPLEGARQGLCSPLVQVRKQSPRSKGPVRGRARTQPPAPLLPAGAALPARSLLLFLKGLKAGGLGTYSTFLLFLPLTLLLGLTTTLFICTMNSLNLSFQSPFSSIGFDELGGVGWTEPIWQMG